MHASFRRSAIRRFGAALALCAAMLLLQGAAQAVLGERATFLIVLPALTFAAIALGRGPALLVLLCGAAVTLSGLLGHGSAPGVQDIAIVPAYLLVGGLLVAYGGKLRLTTSRAVQAEERLRLAQEDTSLGVYELNFESGLAFVSPGLCRLLEQPVQEGPIPLDTWLSMLPSATVEETRHWLQAKVRAGDLRYEREQRIEMASGRVRWLLARVRLTVGPTGELVSARGATIDITERKHTDELLQQTQAMLRQQLDDLQRLQACSQSLVQAGSRLDDALARLLQLLAEFHAADRALLVLHAAGAGAARIDAHWGVDAAALERVNAVLPAWQSAIGQREAPAAVSSTPFEDALAAACGAPAAHAIALQDGAGHALGSIVVLLERARRPDEREIRLGDICAGIAVAVIEREQARAAAAVTEQRFAVALASSAVPFTMLAPVRDAQGRIVDFMWTYVNPAAARVLERPVDALVGRRIEEVLPGSWDRPALFERFVCTVEQQVPCEFELAARLQPGGWFQVIASPLQGSVAVWFADITARKQQQQELQAADRRKDEFLATLAHELRNPLAPIRQAVMLARSPGCDAQRRAWGLDVIDRQVRRMALLLDDLLDVSRITRGSITLRRTPVALREVVESALETARPVLDGKQHHLTVELPPAPWRLDVDALRLSQVLANLLTNAAKYTDEGGRIGLQARVDSGGLTLHVTDNGIGLAAEQLQRVFEMFSQAPDAEGRSQGGLGIGLALARGLVQLHGGTLQASSPGRGRGSRFTVSLPADCVIGPMPQLPADGRPADAPTEAARGLSILVADDNVDAADSLAEMLRMDGHQVRVVYDGRQAVAAFERSRFDVALLDLGMPGLSGFDAARALRRLPHGQHAVLIALTGWGQAHDKAEALAAGFDHHTTKPADPAALLALIALGRAARGSELA